MSQILDLVRVSPAQHPSTGRASRRPRSATWVPRTGNKLRGKRTNSKAAIDSKSSVGGSLPAEEHGHGSNKTFRGHWCRASWIHPQSYVRLRYLIPEIPLVSFALRAGLALPLALTG